MSKDIFFPVETWDSNWMVGILIEQFLIGQGEIPWYFTSSYNVPPARLLGFTYPDYLRYCRAHGAMLRGKNGYTHAVWTDKKECEKICKQIQAEWEKLISKVQFEIGQEGFNKQ